MWKFCTDQRTLPIQHGALPKYLHVFHRLILAANGLIPQSRRHIAMFLDDALAGGAFVQQSHPHDQFILLSRIRTVVAHFDDVQSELQVGDVARAADQGYRIGITPDPNGGLVKKTARVKSDWSMCITSSRFTEYT